VTEKKPPTPPPKQTDHDDFPLAWRIFYSTLLLLGMLANMTADIFIKGYDGYPVDLILAALFGGSYAKKWMDGIRK
jgi:hypothetical protein